MSGASGLLWVRRDDFEIVLFTEREQRIARPTAWMNAAKCGADAGMLFDEGNAAVEVVASEKQVIEHGRDVGLSEQELWSNEGAGG